MSYANRPVEFDFFPLSYRYVYQLQKVHFNNELAQRLANLLVVAATATEKNTSVENRWCQLQDTVQSMALAVLGHARRQHQDLVDDNDATINNLLAVKNRLRKPMSIVSLTTTNAEGRTLHTEKTQIQQRRTEHFRGVLNRHFSISDIAIASMPQRRHRPPSSPRNNQGRTAVLLQESAGWVAIPAEINRYVSPQPMDPQYLKEAIIGHLYKRARNRQLCDTHQGISLLKISGKIFARILLNRLNNHLEEGLLPESQCGFRRHRGTTDRIFVTRQQQKCQETRIQLYSTFVDLTKAFDMANCEGMWKSMQKFGCLERFTQMVRQLCDGVMTRVTENGAVTGAFTMTNGVNQACVHAPSLLSHHLNHRTMHFQSRASTTTIHELLFADDGAPNAIFEEDMQWSMDLLAASCVNFGPIVNTKRRWLCTNGYPTLHTSHPKST
ncbi:hypothetical protein SprV_0301138800 [Sparganum proliferum]